MVVCSAHFNENDYFVSNHGKGDKEFLKKTSVPKKILEENLNNVLVTEIATDELSEIYLSSENLHEPENVVILEANGQLFNEFDNLCEEKSSEYSGESVPQSTINNELIASSADRAEQDPHYSNVLHISTAHFAPYMYQDGTEGRFYSGMEFQLLQVLADRLNMSLSFATASSRSVVCDQLILNVSDICIGGIFPKENALEHNISMSATYASEDLTWCVSKARMIPMYLNHMRFMNLDSWFLIIFGYGYTSGLILYLLMQFDLKYEHRNCRDWHFTTWLVALPACLGMSSNYRPLNGTTRIFFALMLISAFFFFQITFTRSYEFLHKQTPWHQVSSFKEIIENDFHLKGSEEALNMLRQSNKFSNSKIETFHICEDISECLVHLLHNNKLAIGGSRQNILNSPTYLQSEVFCFENLENIASYPVALYMRKNFNRKTKVDATVQQLFEAGFFDKWKRDSQLPRKHEMPYTLPLRLPVTHISAVLIFIIGVGSLMSILTFAAEKLIFWKMKQPNKHAIWKYLEQFVDGQRHYLKNLPERLQQNRHSESIFPYVE
ncbi:hypothetical protein HA402_004591 [Bradysia odoriphaga]|nr:hypothetical protein HA402_004591 [Bradysia odoriphaga]